MSSDEADVELGTPERVRSPTPPLAAKPLRCAVTGQVILDPCIVSGTHACDAFDVALQMIAQYLDGVDGADVCIYKGHNNASHVLCRSLKTDSISYSVPMLRKWYRWAMASNRVQVDVDLGADWKIPDDILPPKDEKLAVEGRWAIRETQAGSKYPPSAAIWYHSFHKNVLDRVGWADAPIHKLGFVLRVSSKKAASSSQHPLHDAWNRACDLQSSLGTGPLLFYGRVYPSPSPSISEEEKVGGEGSGGERTVLAGCMDYRDGARATGTFTTDGLLHGISSGAYEINCPRGRARFRARAWSDGEPVGQYSGVVSTRLNPSFRYAFYGHWHHPGVKPHSAQPNKDAWFGMGDFYTAGASPEAINENIVHIIDNQQEGADRKQSTTTQRLDFQMTVKRCLGRVSEAVGSPTGTAIRRIGFCWVHVYDRSLHKEFAVCFSGPVRWSSYDFMIGGPTIAFKHVEDIDMFAHISTAPYEMAVQAISSQSPNWIRRHAESAAPPGSRQTGSWLDDTVPQRSSSNVIAIYEVSRGEEEGKAHPARDFSARFDAVNLGDHANRIVKLAHMRSKRVMNAWILACRDAVTSRVNLKRFQARCIEETEQKSE